MTKITSPPSPHKDILDRVAFYMNTPYVAVVMGRALWATTAKELDQAKANVSDFDTVEQWQARFEAMPHLRFGQAGPTKVLQYLDFPKWESVEDADELTQGDGVVFQLNEHDLAVGYINEIKLDDHPLAVVRCIMSFRPEYTRKKASHDFVVSPCPVFLSEMFLSTTLYLNFWLGRRETRIKLIGKITTPIQDRINHF